VINDEYSLDEVNLYEWRKRIGYSGHSNLISKNLSTGQKQLEDFKETMNKDNQIIILDEAYGNLDKINREKALKLISDAEDKNKLIIVVNH
jgi:ABC-type lipoprotein export system ATPase subunit